MNSDHKNPFDYDLENILINKFNEGKVPQGKKQ